MYKICRNYLTQHKLWSGFNKKNFHLANFCLNEFQQEQSPGATESQAIDLKGDDVLYSGRIINQIPPKNSRVVICGGGLIGASVAYHLALQGWGPHTTIIEQNLIGEASVWYSSGLVGTFKASHTQVKMAQKSIEVVKDLQNKGYKTGWKQCGSLNLARTRDRMTSFRRMNSLS